MPAAASLLADTGTMTLLLLVLLLVAFSYKKGYVYFRNLPANLFGVRVRQNAFNDYTVSDSRFMSALLLNTVVIGSIILYSWFTCMEPRLMTGTHIVSMCVGSMALLLALFLAAQNMLYRLLGYIFTDKPHAHQLTMGFRASQSLLGLLLLVPAAMIIARPSTTPWAALTGVFCYFSMRLVFICKGFRIFFRNLQSLFYFILYLCSVEIVPCVLVYFTAYRMCLFLMDF